MTAIKTTTSRIDPVREAAAVKALRESIAALAGDDDETLLLDSIEGETDLFEHIDAVLGRIIDDQVLITGVEAAEAALAARRVRFENRVKASRTLIEQAMMIAEILKLERPLATLSLAARQSKVVLEEEADIPAEFWKSGKPVLDRPALTAALKEGRTIPGARLDNAAPSLTARFK